MSARSGDARAIPSPGAAAAEDGACEACLRASWLLGALSAPLDYCARDRTRLIAALALEQTELLAALGGRRRAELEARLRELSPDELRAPAPLAALCPHDPRYPARLRARSAPRTLFLTGTIARLQRLADAPVVAVLGSARASDYGLEIARSIARELAASGVTVGAVAGPGIPAGALAGALQARGTAIMALGHGLHAPAGSRWRSLSERVESDGCVLSELPCNCGGRGFGAIAAERLVAELATVALVVEARAGAGDLTGATVAAARGATIAAVPGRVTSPLSAAPHELLLAGAALVRDGNDVLELIRFAGAGTGAGTGAEVAVSGSDGQEAVAAGHGAARAGGQTAAAPARESALSPAAGSAVGGRGRRARHPRATLRRGPGSRVGAARPERARGDGRAPEDRRRALSAAPRPLSRAARC